MTKEECGRANCPISTSQKQHRTLPACFLAPILKPRSVWSQERSQTIACRRRPVSPLFLAAFLAALLLLSPSPGRAQTYAVSNLGQTTSSSSLTLDLAFQQRFTTGSRPKGYTLESITLDFAVGTSAASDLVVQLRSGTSSGGAAGGSNKIADLTVPSSLSNAGTYTFSAPAGTELDPNTHYFVFINYTSSSNRPSLNVTDSTTEDSGGLSGWVVGNGRYYYQGSWQFNASFLIKIGVSATVENAPARAVSNLAQYSTGSQGFPSSSTLDKPILAQGFAAGSKSGGYTLREVQVAFSSASAGLVNGDSNVGSINDLDVELRALDPAYNRPASTTLATFTNPDELAAGHPTFTAPANTTLNANTPYYVLLRWNGTYDQRPKLWTTTSDNEDSGELSGWSIHDSHYRHSSGSWSTDTKALKIAVISESSLSEPTNVTVSPGECQLTVSWSPPPDEGFSAVRGYHVRVQRSGQWGQWAPVPQGQTQKTIWFITGGQTYEVEVKAYNLQGSGPIASASDGTTGSCRPNDPEWDGFWPHWDLSAPDGQPTGGGIRLTWSALEGASDKVTGYEVEWSADGSTNWQRGDPPHSGTTTRYSHTGLTANKEYSYRVRATGGDGVGEWSDTISVRTAPVATTGEGGSGEGGGSASWLAPLPPAPLAAAFAQVPAGHDGQSAFTLEVHFSADLPLSYRTMRDAVLDVIGGLVTQARRLVSGSDLGWEITVVPDADGAVELVLPVSADCGVTGAICTEDGTPLAAAVVATVPGPLDG